MTVIYCDTCIYRDFYEWRSGYAWLHYGEEAKKILERIKNKEFTLVVSDHLGHQLKDFPQYVAYITEIRTNGNLIEVKATKEDKERASDLAEITQNTEFEDALHAELAVKGGATTLVTDNIEHFAPFQDKLNIRRPEHVDIF